MAPDDPTLTTVPALDPTDLAALMTAVRAAVSDSVACPVLLTQERAWRYLGLSRPTFFRLKGTRGFPAEVSVPGAGVHYRRADLEKWAANLKSRR